MARAVSDDERRARLGWRHRLATETHAGDPVEVARSLTAIHGTDPSSTVLGILARCAKVDTSRIERELYDERSIVRVLGMRRTVFVVNYDLAPAIWSACETTVALTQRKLLARYLAESGMTGIEKRIESAELRLLDYLDAHPGGTSTEIAASDPSLTYRLTRPGADASEVSQSVASRLLTLLSAEGRVIRGRPKGSWTSSQFTWNTSSSWRRDWPERLSPEDADEQIVRSWLAGHGPATIEDLAWWTGWPKGRSRKAIERAGGCEVQSSGRAAYLLASDLEVVSAPAPWIALLPGLDSSTMGWKHRDFYLGGYAGRLFDDVGNAGPTVWSDGRIVGGWAQRASGEIRVHLFEDVGREAQLEIESRAAALEALLGNVRIKPRARRYTPSERALM